MFVIEFLFGCGSVFVSEKSIANFDMDFVYKVVISVFIINKMAYSTGCLN